MYTAKIIDKVTEANGALALTVEFTNGVKTITEVCKPQDSDGFDYWLDSRLTSLETSDELKSEDNLNKVITKETLQDKKTDDVPEDRTTWFNKVNRLSRIKTYGIDLGIFTGEEKEIKALIEDIKATYLPEYILTF